MTISSSDWQLESLRFTLFRSVPIDSVVPLWETLTGEKPERIDSQPRASMIRETGDLGFGFLIHLSTPATISWNLAPSQEQQKSTKSSAVLGNSKEAKERFFSLLDNWLVSDTTPESNRIALGSASLIVTDSDEHSNRILDSLLPHVDIDVTHSTDFSYQINRSILSEVCTNLSINRLSNWKASHTKSVGLIVGTSPEVIEEPVDLYEARLTLDINTSQHNKDVLPKDVLPKLLQELDKLGTIILSEGDK